MSNGPFPRKTPIIVKDEHARIGRSPSTTYYGNAIVQSHQYLNNWSQNGQVFSYSGPPDDLANDTPGTAHTTGTIDGQYYVILGGADKNDTTNPTRRLGGALLPWKYNAWYNSTAADWDDEVSVKWAHDGAAAYIYGPNKTASTNFSGVGYKVRLPYNVKPFQLYSDNFVYNPSADYSYGTLTTTGIQTAALGIWTMPDVSLTSDQHYFFSDDNHSYIAAGRAIRGYTGTGEPSLGDLIHYVGDTAKSDSLIWNSARCLFQWGHPVGVWSSDTGYKHLGKEASTGTNAAYQVRAQNYRGQAYPSEFVTVHPNIVATSTNALVGDKASVRIRSYDSTPALIDTWTCDFYDNALTLYKYSDGSGSDGINILPDEICTITIEIKAPDNSGTGEVLLHTVSLWQPPEW